MRSPAREQLPDLIPLDLLPPKVSGLDVLKALKLDPATPAIPLRIVGRSNSLLRSDFRTHQHIAQIRVQHHPVRPLHYCPVIFVCCSAEQAYLVVTVIGADARPRKPMDAPVPEKALEEVHCFAP
jgi:CheY-like chemotaxis protein